MAVGAVPERSGLRLHRVPAAPRWEGYLFTGEGGLIPAKVLEAPWLTQVLPGGDDVSCVLESELGITRIEGRVEFATFEMGLPEYPQFPILFQGGVRYTWDGEETYGMLERSSMRERIDWESLG